LPNSRNTALQNPLINEDNGDNAQSITLRSSEYGLYVRDQAEDLPLRAILPAELV
jgi:hypothetical protein